MMKYLALFMLFTTQLFAYLPTPPVIGSLCTESDRDFREHRYDEYIAVCERNVSTPRKDQICKRDGVSNRRNYTVDHVIPLFMGGSNYDDNLWCQHNSIYTGNIEQKIYFKLNRGDITQQEAIREIKKIKFKTVQTFTATLF